MAREFTRRVYHRNGSASRIFIALQLTLDRTHRIHACVIELAALPISCYTAETGSVALFFLKIIWFAHPRQHDETGSG